MSTVISRGCCARNSVGTEARARRGAGRQVLDEHVRPRQDAVQQRRVGRCLMSSDQALLAAVEPDEIAGEPARRLVIAAREVALGRSILMTRAPASARREVQYGAATACSSETTIRPARGRDAVMPRHWHEPPANSRSRPAPRRPHAPRPVPSRASHPYIAAPRPAPDRTASPTYRSGFTMLIYPRNPPTGSAFGNATAWEADARLAEPLSFRFDNLLLDKPAGALLRLRPDGQTTRVPLGSRSFAILCLLVERHSGIVTRQEIMDTVWPGLFVEENNLSVQLSNLRRALDTGRDGGSCIQTLPGRGYRFLPEVTPVVARPPHQAADPGSPALVPSAARSWW